MAAPLGRFLRFAQPLFFAVLLVTGLAFLHFLWRMCQKNLISYPNQTRLMVLVIMVAAWPQVMVAAWGTVQTMIVAAIQALSCRPEADLLAAGLSLPAAAELAGQLMIAVGLADPHLPAL